MQKNNNRALVYGAMMTAIFVILLFITAYMPVISFLSAFVLPLPIILYAAQFEYKSTFVVAIASIAIGSLGGIMLVPIALSFVIVGVAIGVAIKANYSKVAILMTAGLTVLATTTISYVITIKVLGVNVISEILNLTRESYITTNKVFLAQTGKEFLKEAEINQMMSTLNTLIPALVTLSSFLLAFITLLFCFPIMRRLGINVPKFAPFKNMRLPNSILWYYLAVVTVKLFVQPELGTTLFTITYNADTILSVLLVLQAFSLIAYFIDSKGMPKAVTIIACLVLAPMYPLLVLVGVLDLGFPLRSFITNKSSK